MPFKSEKQRRYLWLKHPDIAEKWAHEGKSDKKEYVKKHKANRKRTGLD